MTTLEQIRVFLSPYVSETSGLADLPEGLLALLEAADGAAQQTAESIEGILALHSVNRISKDSMRAQLRALLAGYAPPNGSASHGSSEPEPTKTILVNSKWVARIVFVENNAFDMPFLWPPSPSGSNWNVLPNAGNTSTDNDAKVSFALRP